MSASTNSPRLEIAFDIGHSSIGWAVVADASPPTVLGCGSVVFEKDSALANARRLHRSQRRHVRATRQRISRMEKLLGYLGILSPSELAARHRAGGGSATPWLLAARVLASNGARPLTWPELWDVLRWYAHNRGYEEIGVERAEDAESAEKKEDTEKVNNAKAALARFGKKTMAETICAWLGQDPLAERTGTIENYKAKNCAFERPLVVAEVKRILAAHRGKLNGVDDTLIAALILDARAIAVPSIRLPRRYRGSLLFGRLTTRYDNRIIGRCPISDKETKVPNKNCPEFLRYRWAMQLANLRVADSANAPLRTLNIAERKILHDEMTHNGALTPGELKKLVAALPGHARDNLEQFFLHPDAREGLVLDPVQKLIVSDARIAAAWPHLPERLQKRIRGRWRRGKSTTLAALREEAAQLGHDCAPLDAAIDALCAPLPAKSKKKTPPPTRDELLMAPLDARRELAKLSGRAPYGRALLTKAFEDVLAGRDPKATGGCLEETDAVRCRREARPIPQQTNNHLVRHRLQILGRLLVDLIADPTYGAGDAARISRITLEVNRDLREMAGLTAQDIAKELGQRLAGHKKVSARLEKELPEGTVINAGLIRKARIADDLGWRCPYTGIEFEPKDLVERRVDKDHIIPRSQRATDSLDALVVTFSTINKWKGQRTSWQFVSDEGGKTVPDAPNLCIMPLARYKEFVEKLDTKGHPDDCHRKRRRKEWLLLPAYEEKSRTFTQGHLTQTSQLARLAAQVVRAPFNKLPETPQLVALPGSVTGNVRKAWNVLGCLAAAVPNVLEPDGTVKTKTEIRDITHLHHALDAGVLALAAHFIPNRGDVWRLLTERRLDSAQQAQLATLGLFDFDAHGQFRLRDLAPELKAQLRARLAERRVVQHVPSDMSGLRVEENTRGIRRRENGRVFLRQRKKNADGVVVVNHTDEPEGKVIGLPRMHGSGGKLAALNGVRVIDGNFGIAILDHPDVPEGERVSVVRFFRVWQRLRELRARNGGRNPRMLRNGFIVHVPRGSRAGTWRILSTKETEAFGIAVNLAVPDGIKLAKGNAPVIALVRDGLVIIPPTLAGIHRE